MKRDDVEAPSWPAPSEGAEVPRGCLILLFCLLVGLAGLIALVAGSAS